MLQRTTRMCRAAFPQKFATFPDASFVDDDTPGAISSDMVPVDCPSGQVAFLSRMLRWLKSWERRFALSAQEKARRGT